MLRQLASSPGRTRKAKNCDFASRSASAEPGGGGQLHLFAARGRVEIGKDRLRALADEAKAAVAGVQLGRLDGRIAAAGRNRHDQKRRRRDQRDRSRAALAVAGRIPHAQSSDARGPVARDGGRMFPFQSAGNQHHAGDQQGDAVEKNSTTLQLSPSNASPCDKRPVKRGDEDQDADRQTGRRRSSATAGCGAAVGDGERRLGRAA